MVGRGTETMRHEQFAAKIAYACIFSKTVAEARDTLLRLIAGRIGGFDEGTTAWCAVLSDYPGAPDDLGPLNRFGASFTAAQWSLILDQVRNALLAIDCPR